MRKGMLAAAALLMAALAQGAEQEAAEVDISHCRFPETPTIPDGAAATESEMGQAGADVREFIADTQASLECLAEVEASLGEEITPEQQAQLIAIHNNGVDQMTAAAERYNAQVQAFKGE